MNVQRLVHPGFWFGKTPRQDALELAKRGAGGFCLYGGTRRDVADFTRAVRAVSPLPYILISADYEDGLGRWLPDAELLPSNMALGAAGDETLSFEKGFITARQAKSLGVDWVFAPVADLADNAFNPIVNTRSFGARTETVLRLAGAFMDGLRKGGALNSLKHFPGHGNTQTDSHLALPRVPGSRESLREKELAPFRALCAKADSVMAGHLLVPAWDGQNPASLSRILLTDLLKREWGYGGLVLTDALLMKAIGNEKTAALAAFNAGADVLLVPEKPFELMDFLEKAHLPVKRLESALRAQDKLCAFASAQQAATEEEAFRPTDFARRTAEKALARKGNIFTLSPGETVFFLETGNDDGLPAAPFLRALEARGIRVRKYTGGPADKLLVLCFRQYQAFKGQIALGAAEARAANEACKNAGQSVFVSFASPWTAQSVPAACGALFAFSPAPAFQQAAADALSGRLTAAGKIPVSV